MVHVSFLALACGRVAPLDPADGAAGGQADGNSYPPVGAALVPGGTFTVKDASGQAVVTTVAPFWLDVTEVTVEAFRRFVEAGRGTRRQPPAAGSGATASGLGGWETSWNGSLPKNRQALEDDLSRVYQPQDTWLLKDPNLPINNVNWYVSFAYCIWRGGRLPTELEWEFAATGGDDQREYPWGSGIDHTKAAYYEDKDSDWAPPYPVGAFSPQGDARWGHKDMAGNQFEWTRDVYSSLERATCDGCVFLEAQGIPLQLAKGGSLISPFWHLRNSFRQAGGQPSLLSAHVGMRCAYNR